MANRHGQLDVAHAFTTHTRLRHFHAAAVADDALVLDALELTARTFPVLLRAEDAFTEETIAFRTVGAVVDGFRILHFTVRPLTNGVGRSQCDAHCIVLGCRREVKHILMSSVRSHKIPPN